MSTAIDKTDHTKAIISLGFLAVFSLMILVIWLSMATLKSVNSSMSALVKDTNQKTSRAYQMRDVIRLRSHSVHTLLQNIDPFEQDQIFRKLIKHTENYTESRVTLESLGANTREQEILDRISTIDQRVAQAYDSVSLLIHSTAYSPEELKSVLGDVQLQELVLLNQLNDLVQLEKQLAREALTNNQSDHQKMRQLLLGIVVAAFVLSIMISVMVITRVSRANRRIAHLANHDDLTGLHNRRSFESQLKHTMGLAQRSENAYGLLYMDLDRFKIVNDTCGHHAGDLLLNQLTDMLQRRLRRGDLFARVGGDEFAIIAQGKSFEDIIRLAEDLRVMVSEFTFHYSGQEFKVSLSIGVIPILGDILEMDQILSDVDSACYVAKQSGRNRVHVTAENDTEVVKYRNDIAGIKSIRQALAEERLTLYYQPVFKIEPDRLHMAHCEILLRIRSENGELFSPAKFIPIAEKYNIMTEIDRWVFTHVMEWADAHQYEYEVPRLLINLSSKSLINDEFLEFVEQRLQKPGARPTNIAFEITETTALDNIEKANIFIARIRALGCQVALDDFGSGFSTFAYLKSLPIDYLKIDGSLVKNMSTDTVDREMVKAINEIGHTVGALTIAEFVEDEQTLKELRELGVDYAQGYGLRTPSALTELVDELPRLSGDTGFRKAS